MQKTINGRAGISATIVQDSLSNGKRLTTFELIYPRFIHAEFMTHRMISKNSASSRAIPVPTMHKHIMENTAMPVFWGKQQAGMQAGEELQGNYRMIAEETWINGRNKALDTAKALHDFCGLHKQIANRPTEAYQMMKVIASGTEWANILWLRNHKDAQPEFQELASCIAEALLESPQLVTSGQWHLPYITRVFSLDNPSIVAVYKSGDQVVSAADAIKISASCCAQVSYRKFDDSLEKAISIFDKLIISEPMHASPVEHQAKSMEYTYFEQGDGLQDAEPGVTHMRRDGSLWSGNFQGWIQYRQLLENHTKW